jgi:hypothetical protein
VRGIGYRLGGMTAASPERASGVPRPTDTP